MTNYALFFAALYFAGLPLLTCQPALAQGAGSPDQIVRLKVGDAAVTGSQLKPYTNLWNFTMQKPGTEAKPAGSWSDALEVVDLSGKPAMKRTQVAKYDKGIRLTFVSVFDPATMEPLSFDYSRSDNWNVRHVDFQNSTATYRHTDNKDAKPEEATANLGQQVFDFYGGMYGLLVSALPLKDGYTAEIPTLDTNKMAIDWVPVRVKGRETVDAGAGKKTQTWVVETPTKFYGKMTWWVTK
ncbi:MAG: DUF3108 domain-containing protein [Bryobacteraceae bacterium]